MVTNEEIMIRLTGQDNTGGMFSSVQSKLGAMKVAAGAAVTAASAGVLSFAKDSISTAIESEKGWNAFNTAVSRVGGNTNELRTKVTSLADSLHRSTADIRTAATDYMNFGADASTAMNGVAATSAMAAAKNIDFSTAESYVMSALKGRGAQLKTLGIDINNYKDSTTGAIDTTRLFNDVLAKFGSSQDLYNGSAAAQIQDYETGMARLKSAIGQGLLPVLQTFVPLLTTLTNAFANAPGPVKTVVSVLIGLGATLGVLAGPIMMIQGAFGGLLPVISSIGGSVATLGAKFIAFATSGEVISTVTTVLKGMKMAVMEVEAVEIASAAAHASNGVAITAEGSATIAASTGFWAMAAAELAALWPIALIVAAVAALIITFEKVGEYFGWWKDFGTMLESIGAGVQRLWNAFAGSEQVQGTIRDVAGAFQWLWSTLSSIVGPIVNVINKILNPSGGNWNDPVGQIISTFGRLGKICGDVVNVIKRIPQTIQQLPTVAGQAITRFIGFWITLPIRIGLIVAQLLMRIGQFVSQGVQRFVQGGARMVTGFIGKILTIPARVLAIFSGIAANMINGLAQAVSTAISYGQQILDGVIQFISQIPGKVAEEFMKIPEKIMGTVTDAVNAAADWGGQVLNAVLNALDKHSPGKIQREVLLEFQQTGERIPETYSIARKNAHGWGNEVLNGFNNGLDLANKINTVSSDYNNIGTAGGNITILNVSEGAVNANMGNLTTKQSKQVLINALEGLGNIDTIVTKGV